MKIVRDFFDWHDNLYEILRAIPEDHKPVVDVWRTHLKADTVLRRDGMLYFCIKVQDAEIIEPEKQEIPDIVHDVVPTDETIKPSDEST